MAHFSQTSLDRLHTVHSDLQILFKYVVQYYDCTVISGYRTVAEQQALYAKGRTEPGSIVTYKDGVIKKSKHQTGLAVDVVPYPSMYSDKDEMIRFAGFVLGVATLLHDQGIIENEVEWGGDWEWSDKPHFQLKIKE